MKNRKLKLQELNRLTKGEFNEAKKTPLVVVLDNIRSLNNIGSVFRTCDAFRIEKIILCGITAQPPHREIHKTAIGATETVMWEYEKDVVTAVSKLALNGYETVVIEQTENSVMLNDFKVNVNAKYAIIMGNEVEGVQQSVINLCNAVVEVPQIGTKHSLNISVCTGVVLWEFFRILKRDL